MVGEGSREKERLAESRVYSRKSVKGPKTNRNNNLGQPRARTIASDDADLSQQQLLTRFEADSSSLNYSQGFLMQENRVSISLSSRSKQEMQRLRRKLESELDLVRNWVKKIEGKDGQGPLENGKGQGSGELGHGLGLEKFTDRFIKSCSALLEKLMKHKHGWVFNEPVDPKALGLHDYLDVIKNPMDLGTVKTRLNTNWYKSPREFAEDVRLTFRNAMTYNPKGDDVHAMAEQLSKIFEDKWVVIEADYMRELRISVNYEVGLPTPTSRKLSSLASPAIETRKVSDRSESMVSVCDPKSKPMNLAHLGRTPAPKKPKAKDPVKRDMTYDEKQKLSMNLQNLPSEKLGNVVQIIKKRNSSLCQKDDEIEVDIDSVDTETLWELDRFVTNYRKSLSKNKRKAELAIQARAEEASYTQNPPSSVVEAPKETGTGKNFCVVNMWDNLVLTVFGHKYNYISKQMKRISPLHLLVKWKSRGIMQVDQAAPAVNLVPQEILQVLMMITYFDWCLKFGNSAPASSLIGCILVTICNTFPLSCFVVGSCSSC